MPSKYDMAANEPATYAWGEAQDPAEEAEWREQSRRVAAVVEAAIAWADAEYDEDYVEEQTLLRRVNYLRKLEGESDG